MRKFAHEDSFLQKSDVPQVIRDLVLRGLASREETARFSRFVLPKG